MPCVVAHLDPHAALPGWHDVETLERRRDELILPLARLIPAAHGRHVLAERTRHLGQVGASVVEYERLGALEAQAVAALQQHRLVEQLQADGACGSSDLS